MKYNCLIVDDERPALKLLEAYIQKFPLLNLVDSCENAMQALKALQENAIEILFLDIQMPDLTGLELLQTLSQKPQVILTTAYREYAVEGFALEVTDYLVKPFSFERFVQASNRAIKNIGNNNSETAPTIAPSDNAASKMEEHLFLKTNYKMEKVAMKDILYVESMREYVSIHTDKKRYVLHQTMNNMEKRLPFPFFIRVHRSFIVAMNHIDAINGNTVHIKDKVISIGGSYRKTFFENIQTL